MAGKGAGAVSAAVMGAFLCLGLIFLAIAATIILSLISIYTPDHSEAGSGDEYTADAMMLEVLYTNTSGDSYSNAPVAESSDLSTQCTTQLAGQDSSNSYHCVVTNGVAYSSEISTRRRRRANAPVARVYMIYKMRVFFKNRCTATGDKNKTASTSSLSACVKKRLQYCNNIFKDQATSVVTWTTSPAYTLSVFDSTANAYQTLALTQISGVPRTLSPNLGSMLGATSGKQGELGNGCRYVGPLSIAAIDNAVAVQASATTTISPTVAVG